MTLDPRIPTIDQSAAPLDGPHYCVLCGKQYRTVSNHRYPMLCGHVCIRYAERWTRRLAGLCPWCDQHAGEPHLGPPCRPGFVAMPGRKGVDCAKCHRDVEAGAAHAPNCSLAIFERDEWRCQLCGKPIDPLLPSGHPWGPTFDHILPDSQGGHRGAANLRASHRLCNMDRGAPLLD